MKKFDRIEAAQPSAGPVGLAAPLRREEADPEFSEILIRPRAGWIAIDWKELIHFRELLYYLALRDLKIRYKQTSLGVAWAVLQPLFTMIIVTIIFGRFAGLPSEGVPYAVFVFAGLIPWTFFYNGVTTSGLSLVNQQQMLTKIYFPRLFVPTSAIGVFLVDLMISLVIYALILAFYRFVPSWQIVFLPPIVLLTILATLGLGYTLAASIVLYRDIRHTVPFFMQILMYVSPVIYPLSMLSPRYRRLLSLNPLCGIIGAYRSSILGTPWDLGELAISTATTVALFAFGLYYFRRTERYFADIA
jgi:homopolymeric O-antigen transport system permease protein